MDLAQACGVSRVVLPLSPGAAGHAKEAASRGLAVSFYNVAMDAATVFDWLEAAKKTAPAIGLTFSAAGFARTGECPFLTSYRAKLRRSIVGLDAEDCLYDGTPQPLGAGNAEIRELVSILRCGNFAGDIVLGPGNRHVGNLPDATRRFMELLERM